MINQDIHWAGGFIGYFPSYALGYLYAASIYKKLEMSINDFNILISKGELGHIREFLRKNIHSTGRELSSLGLIKEACGHEFGTECFVDYIKNKYQERM